MATLVNVNGTIINFDNLEYISQTQDEQGNSVLNFTMVSGQVVYLSFTEEEAAINYLANLLEVDPETLKAEQ